MESRDGEENFTSLEGSAQIGEYTEEDNVSVVKSVVEEIITTWHALEAPDSVYEIGIEDDSQDEETESSMSTISDQGRKKDNQTGNPHSMRLAKAYLLNEATLSELNLVMI